MANGLRKMTTNLGKGLLGYAVDTIVCPHDDDENLMVAEQNGYVPFYTVRCLLLHRAVVFGSFSPNLTALSGFLCTSFVPIKEGYLMSNVGWSVSWLRFAS